MKTYLALIFLVTASAASAQQLSMSEKLQIRDDCGQDFKRLCPGMRPGGGQLMGCVRSKKEQLSKTCSATLSTIMTRKDE